jgi:hypothetical protein
MSPRPGGETMALNARLLFQPLQWALDDYTAVLDKNGSLAVATGYRSVARRLLDRLEAVFARNIASETCACIMCLEHPIPAADDETAGVNWGEVLELVSGRHDLPTWPPFDHTEVNALGIESLEAPCQQIDVDVPAEYHDHYARLSRKTKTTVQSWLSSQQEAAPEEADDETLTFATLTRLEQAKRPLFYALLYGLDHIPPPRSQPTREQQGTPPIIQKAGLALQRLYRLASFPRDQLVAMYLIRHPHMHNILATLAAVTKHEWEILISGRFDGFLWSGAESINAPFPGTPSRTASRTGMPQEPFSRPGSTHPGSGPAPVQVDEETEIAILAEVEREIHSSMDALENAFELLHLNAEAVRERLRHRSAALLMAAQQRRGTGGIEVRIDTPAGFADVDGDSLDDLRSDIGPDDSASNVSHNRRRAHRHRVRRTPAPVEEEPEPELETIAEKIRRRF